MGIVLEYPHTARYKRLNTYTQCSAHATKVQSALRRRRRRTRKKKKCICMSPMSRTHILDIKTQRKQKNERTQERKNERTKERKNERTKERKNARTKERKNARTKK
ncbi:hypothetical protein EJ05DRAFT_172283 [Pseudovirgaria hyperparasitica]|uniref:Uncharacterized protein n=1 Tax=Pseudovirgaria hyperparasitica TaxID=470096 RepID=A0A6A6VT04_9PEZI|nr:uncharacterized protein EJ05DRAFT_172283 [Pseudovirgaria hyperparasitica]KAF2753808.1 hypothetical protein EJ05DRAFT_172283 [Pseudovirgaria hyperparasitica]